MTTTKIVLAAALMMSTATVAMADTAKRHSAQGAKATPVRVDQSRNMSMAPSTNNLMMNVMDRASSPFACGG